MNKARDLTTAKLHNGDITGAKIREIVMRDLNEITTKLEGLSRTDLLSSYSFLKEGVDLLNVSLDQSMRSTQQDHVELSTMLSCDAASAILNEVLKLTRAVEKIKIKSYTEYESAKDRFKDARKEATKAFCNEALTIHDRIFAAKLRVVSEILENLESPKIAITGCLSFLRDLHRLAAIREIFSVYFNGGVWSQLFGKEEREANVMSIMLINYVLFQFTLNYGGKLADRLNWPAGIIELADRSFNPVLEWQKVSLTESMGEEFGPPPNELVLDERINPPKSVVNAHGEIIVKHSDDEIKIISRTEDTKVVKLPEPSEDIRRISGLAVDNSNNLHVVRYLKPRPGPDVIVTYVLHVLDDNYNVKHVSTLDFLKKIDGSEFINIAINKNNDIILIRGRDSSVYVFDNCGKLKHKFERDSSFLRFLSISSQNEIMISSDDDKAINFYTELGKLTSTIKLPEGHDACGVAFHYVLGKIVALTHVWENKSYFLLCYSEAGELESSTFFCNVTRSSYENESCYLLCYSEAGKPESTPFFCDVSGPESFPSITSHPAGPVAVFKEKRITFI